MSMSNRPAAATIRERVPLGEARSAAWAVQHGENFRVFKQPFTKAAPLAPASQADVAGKLGDANWKLVYFASSNVERPAKTGWMGYTIELQSVSLPTLSNRYVFDAPSNSELKKLLRATRVRQRLAKANGP